MTDTILLLDRQTDILKTAQTWADARAVVLAETTPDVRTSESFRERLNALADAEAALFAAVKVRKETA